VKISKLSETELLEQVRTGISSQKRGLSLDQQALVKSALTGTFSPLYATLLAHESGKWPSWFLPNAKAYPNSLFGFLERKLEAMEKKHGLELCSVAFSYIECAFQVSDLLFKKLKMWIKLNFTYFQGITETELLDLLSSSTSAMKSFLLNDTTGKSNVIVRPPYLSWFIMKCDLG